MTRILFTLTGDKVQDVGYRLFLLESMKNMGIVGFAVNHRSGKQVNVEVWGTKKLLQEFYNLASSHKPKKTDEVIISQPFFDEEPKPSSQKILNEKMDLMIEQTSSFVQGSRQITIELERIPKKIEKEHKITREIILKMPK